jgi:hypothetical protein
VVCYLHRKYHTIYAIQQNQNIDEHPYIDISYPSPLLNAETENKIACEMKFMRRTAGDTKWDLQRNEEVLKELKVEPILDYICRYQNN